MDYTMREIRTGLLVVISSAILFVGIWLAGGSSASLGARKSYMVRFRNIALLPGRAKVAYGGVAVGEIAAVRRIDPAAEDGSVAEAEIRIDPELVLRTGDRVVITSVSMIGEKFLDIEPGPEDAPVLVEGGALIGGFGGFGGIVEDAGGLVPVLEEAVVEARDLAADLRGSVGKLNAFIESAQGTVEESRGAIAGALERAGAALAEMESILEQNRQTIRSTLEGVEARVDEARPLVADAAALAADAREKIGGVLESLESLSGRLDAFVDRAEGLLVSADPKLLETLDQLRIASRNLADASATVRADPSVLIWGTDEEESGAATPPGASAADRPFLGPYGTRP